MVPAGRLPKRVAARAGGPPPRGSFGLPAGQVETMRRSAWWFGVVIVAGVLAGCVERRYVITSDPPGAAVFRNGQFIGSTPVDDHFLYYGNYHYTLVKDGFETLQVDQPIPAPWWEY